MKKLVSIVLVLCILFTGIPVAYAFNTNPTVTCNDPVIYIGGDSDLIYYNNDTESFSIDNIFGLLGVGDNEDDDDDDDSKIFEASFNILKPFILEGIAFGKWDNYYDAVEKEISEMFAPIMLDENGNIPEDSDSGIGAQRLAMKQSDMTRDKSDANGKYTEKGYTFYYDWRLDPIELADQLHEYIEAVKKATKHSKVSLTCRCLGTNVAIAYINKYGTDSLKGLGIDVATSNGADFLSGIISGDFGIDGNSIARLIADIAYFEEDFSVSPIITSTIELLANTGVLDTLTSVARRTLYAEIEYGIISALATSTFLTMPCYWALVSTEDFETALTYVFGKEGSEKRKEYAGLIEKITIYNETIKKNVDSILQEAHDDGVNLCVVSKYGTQMVPVLKDGSILGDQYVSVKNSSFGATTSTIYDTLPDEYIAQQTALGLGRYISPDKQVDASTCLFPDYTWFVKGCSHGFYSTQERDLLLTVMDADRQLTIDDLPWTQFIAFNYEAQTFEPMTEENCHTENWEADSAIDNPVTKEQKLISFLKSLFKWIAAIFGELFDLEF